MGPSFKKSGNDFGTFPSFVPELFLAAFKPGSDSDTAIGKSNGKPKQKKLYSAKSNP